MSEPRRDEQPRRHGENEADREKIVGGQRPQQPIRSYAFYERQEKELSEAKREIAQLKQELLELHGDEDDVFARKRKKPSESEEGGKVARLSTEIWTMIAAKLNKNDVTAFALTSKQHREAQQQAGRKLVTRPCCIGMFEKCEYFTRDWCVWWSRRFNMTETRDECMNRVIMVAAYHGYLDVLKTYWSDVPEDKMALLMDARTCIWVARGGHLETLQWLRSQGCPWDKYMCSVAAAYGHLKCLQWARENGCPWIANHMCDEAANHGHLAVLEWVREQGCPWDEATTLYAARNGHLKCLRWLISQGCPWNREACRSRGSRNIQQWMRKQENLE